MNNIERNFSNLLAFSSRHFTNATKLLRASSLISSVGKAPLAKAVADVAKAEFNECLNTFEDARRLVPDES